MNHPLVLHSASDPSSEESRAKALKGCIKRTVKQLKKKERENPPAHGRSVAEASFTLLRLKRDLEGRSLGSLREEVVKKWKNRKGEPMKEDSFRIHVECEHVHGPFGREFLALARRELSEQGIALDEESAYLEPARTMAERMARSLETLEKEWHGERMRALGSDGSLRIKDEDEMLSVLLALNGLAEHSFHAVDHAPISKWSSNHQLKNYLKAQLKRIRESKGTVTLERIRLVSDSELSSDQDRRHLRRFIKAHKDASARLLLMPTDALSTLEVTFNAHNGLLLADAGTDPVAITGRLGESTVGRALVHTRKGNEMRALLNEYEILKGAAEEHDYDTKLREQLGE